MPYGLVRKRLTIRLFSVARQPDFRPYESVSNTNYFTETCIDQTKQLAAFTLLT